MEKPVIIIGAGVSGLLLAQGLQKAGMTFQVFERDASLNARTQGYRVRISDDGIKALQQNLSPEHFSELKRCCSIMPTKNNVPSHVLSATDGGEAPLPFAGGKKLPVMTEGPPLSADRHVLRAALLKGIEAHIDFGKSFLRYEETNDSIAVHLSDGSVVEGSILVGADGTWSKVRRQALPDYQLCDTGARPIFGKTPITDNFLADFTSLQAMSGLTLLRSPAVDCLFEPMRFDASESLTPADYIYWVLFLRQDAYTDDFSPSDDHSMLEILEFAQQKTEGWSESFRSLFTQPNSSAGIIRIVTSNPEAMPTNKNLNSRVVLIGDAAHAMAPTAALGATTALQDANVLIRYLIDSNDQTATALRKFELEMRGYAVPALQKSMMGGKVMFGMKPFNELPLIGFRSTE